MRAVGIFATALGVAAIAGATYVAVRSLPDIKRYLRIKSM